jgi:hypothetical protein
MAFVVKSGIKGEPANYFKGVPFPLGGEGIGSLNFNTSTPGGMVKWKKESVRP